MDDVSPAKLWTDTDGCKKSLHKGASTLPLSAHAADCFDMWAKANAGQTTCPWCRNVLSAAQPGPSNVKMAVSQEGFENICRSAPRAFVLIGQTEIQCSETRLSTTRSDPDQPRSR